MQMNIGSKRIPSFFQLNSFNFLEVWLPEKGSGIRFRLISLWPIYERNAPASAFEEKGLHSVAKQPNRPYTGVVKSGKSRYFQAIYADKAIAKACVTCHNTHPLSPRRDFKLNEVMGGIVITIPLDK